MNADTLTRELAAAVDAPVLDGDAVAPYLLDATEARGLRGRADAVVLAQTANDVARALAWCYEHDVPLTTRGGGSGYAGGAVPDGGVVVALAGLRSVRSIEPLLWRAEIESGVTTREVQQLALENGLYYPPDPGAAEQSQLGGNVATNAGGPHAFKYGVTGAWVTGLEVAIAPGELVTFGRGLRKDVAGYDIRSLLIGSEGTLGIVTAVRLKLIPPPEARRPVVAFYGDAGEGAAAVLHAMASGTLPAAIEFFDGAAFAISGRAFPLALERADRPAFVVIAEADGSEEEAATGQMLLREALSAGAEEVLTPSRPEEVAALWRWRDGMGIAADSYLGGKVSEDVCVPVDRLAEVVAATHEAAGGGTARGLLLGPRRRRQRPLLVPLRRWRRRCRLARRGGGRARLRRSPCARRQRHGRARGRPRQVAAAPQAALAGRRRRPSRRQAPVRPEGPAEPG